MFLSNFIEQVKSSEVYVSYCGDFSNRIGPPTSMRNLYILLSSDFRIMASRNISKIHSKEEGADVPSGSVAASAAKYITYLRRTKFGDLLANVRLLFLIIQFNFYCNLALFKNPRIKLIITQPFLWQICGIKGKKRVIYIRRSTMDANVAITSGCVKRAFEHLFMKTARYELVYLVPIECASREYIVIPNHFDVSQFQVAPLVDSPPRFFYVGTWCERKGAKRLLDYLNYRGRSSCPDVEVYGGIGEDSEINEALFSCNFLHFNGVVNDPYRNFKPGDVFFSLSRHEGLQRSLVEAMLSGCVIVCVDRPDSRSLSNCNGVYCFPWEDGDVVSSLDRMDEVIRIIDALSFSQRADLGLSNREFALLNYSESKVLESWREILHEQTENVANIQRVDECCSGS